MKKTACVPGSRAQADSKIGESLFHDCFNGAVVNTGAAVDTCIGNSVSHLFSLQYMYDGASKPDATIF